MAAVSLTALDKHEKFFLDSELTSERELYIPISDVKDSEGKIFSISPVYSLEDLEHISTTVDLDYRVKKEDTEKTLSCLKGIALDPHFTRAQVFSIKDKETCIGVATLIVIPYSNRISDIYFKRVDDELVVQPFSELFTQHPNSFVIETAFMKILPQYRHKKLGEAIINQVFLPIIGNLCSQSLDEIIVKSGAQGGPSFAIQEKMIQIFKNALLTGCGRISISEEMETYLGQARPESTFSLHQSMKHLDLIPNVFNFCLGPVFAKIIAPSRR